MDTVPSNSDSHNEPKVHGNYGRKHTEATRQRMSDAHKGKTTHMKGKHHSLETRQKLSEANKRRPPITEETRDKLSKAHKGRRSVWKDTPIPQETRQKMMETRKRNGPFTHTAETKAHLSQVKKGKHFSPEHRAKLAASAQGNQHLKNYWHRLSSDERLDRVEKWVRAPKLKNDTSIERAVCLELDKRGIAYITQYRIGRFWVDIFIPSCSVVIEVDGCYWHSCIACGYDNPQRREYDRVRLEKIAQKGYTVLRIWEHALRADARLAVGAALAQIPGEGG